MTVSTSSGSVRLRYGLSRQPETEQRKLRAILNQGNDPARYQKQNNVAPVEYIIRYIAEQLQTKP
jgi:hypothetical protein